MKLNTKLFILVIQIFILLKTIISTDQKLFKNEDKPSPNLHNKNIITFPEKKKTQNQIQPIERSYLYCKWNESNCSKLYELISQGSSNKKIALALNCKQSKIQCCITYLRKKKKYGIQEACEKREEIKKMERLKQTKSDYRSTWTEKNDEKLNNLYLRGKSIKEIANELGKSNSAITNRLIRSKNEILQEAKELRNLNSNKRQYWTKENENELCDLLLKGYSIYQISNQIGRSESSIYTHVNQFRNTNETLQKAFQMRNPYYLKKKNKVYEQEELAENKAKIWSKEEIEILISFWKQKFTKKEIAKILNRTRISIQYKIRDIKTKKLI